MTSLLRTRPASRPSPRACARPQWPELERESGLTRAQLEHAANIYIDSAATILCWGMGITQHHRSVATIQMLANLLLLRGNVGKPGAGPCPVRGHSNVQGDRTMGIYEKPSNAFLDKLGDEFAFAPPREPGFDTLDAINAMHDGRGKVFFALGGNFATATPDTARTHVALRNCVLTVHVSTKLNRSHLVHGRAALILPCLGRTEIDLQAGGPQAVTVEDSMSMVHLSAGMNPPASDAAAVGAGDRGAPGRGDPATQQDAVAGPDRGLRPHPRPHRAGDRRLHGLQHAGCAPRVASICTIPIANARFRRTTTGRSSSFIR